MSGIYGYTLRAVNEAYVLENIFGNVSIDLENKMFIIKGINYDKFLIRFKEMYKYKNIINLFTKEYTKLSLILYKNKLINKNKLKIKELRVHLFFALEVYKMFMDLYYFYNIPFYKKIADEIYKKTWISKYETVSDTYTNITNLSKFNYTLKDYQLEYIKEYTNRKLKYDMVGDILVFKQGLGKTLTAVVLAECLNKKQIIIVCPNSLKENWAYEIKSYYKIYSNNEEKWIDDIYINGISKFTKTKSPKFIITNQESIDKIYSKTKQNKDSMIIVDECHNFRNIDSKRTKELIKLKEMLDCKDNLMMSGTPIKATPDEIAPALRMIDPYFTDELARIYISAFKNSTIDISNVVKERFNRVMYVRTKEQVLELKEKNIEKLNLTIKNPDKYSMITINTKISTRIQEIYQEKLKGLDNIRKEFEALIWKYSSASVSETRNYLHYIYKLTSPDKSTADYYDIDIEKFNEFLNKYVYPNIMNNEDMKKLKQIASQYIHMYESAVGLAIGEILPEARNNCYIDLLYENEKLFVNMINENPKKTIIFTPFLKVTEEVVKVLERNNIGCVKIVGETKNRMDLIQKFKESDLIDVLVATTQTLSTGVTLVEANQMFFFGVPYREADFEQACDRIHRIGQTLPVNIYIVTLQTPYKNITDRLNEILDWSGEISTAMIEQL